ncbi:MAG: 23S rRNA (guanosine(2251)-2'-O)-methyltransferase RlmB [Verrucomicrobia bacterium]|nr:23S rRNA (guanosine(2251)-2'-O)-methyltransferase RlmB [Verrucomicrobiota bacterium]MBU6446541.1 23S rRNA (guanosine(2251)-2'-O)-methyltransferase RlmB [Verrucomicrobiota bacterium]MDE3046943.1 23S rRNA (guanosine(2251)-2'-O)-methyltransferase RlmB [Verrucomicrobiota bacterium]
MNDPHSYARLPPKDQLIMGAHAIDELLRYAPEKIIQIYTVQNKKSPLLQEAKALGVQILTVSESTLTKMAGSDSHQGFVAHIRGRTFLDVETFLETAPEQSLVLMMDQIFDPQNFGALIRSAECFGASAVVWSKNRGSDLTPTASKASSGASELIPLIRISNLASAVDAFKKGGFEIVAALLDPKSESAYTFQCPERTVLIVGSEGEGIQPLLRKKADRSVYLPMQGKISSLNVAQATAALLALFRRTGPR